MTDTHEEEAEARDCCLFEEACSGPDALLEKRHHRPELVLYDAGVGVYADDQLGYLNLSHAGIYQRDRYVIDTCVARSVPIACVIGGGYDRNAQALARRHALLHRAASHVWRQRRLGS